MQITLLFARFGRAHFDTPSSEALKPKHKNMEIQVNFAQGDKTIIF